MKVNENSILSGSDNLFSLSMWSPTSYMLSIPLSEVLMKAEPRTATGSTYSSTFAKTQLMTE